MKTSKLALKWNKQFSPAILQEQQMKKLMKKMNWNELFCLQRAVMYEIAVTVP